MAICLGRNILNLDVNIGYCVRALQVLPGTALQRQNKWAAHLTYLTKPLLTGVWKNASCPSTAKVWIQWNPSIWIITDLWPGRFFWRRERYKIIFSGVVTSSSLSAKKCSTPSCSCPDRTGITRVGREAKGSLWKVSFASPAQRNKLNELKPRSHDREPWFLCLYLFAQLFVVLAGTAWAAELQPVTRRLFFPLSPPTDSWELNWNIFLFCCQPDRGCFSCSWNQHHGQKFPSFLSGDSAGVFPWQQVWIDTAFLCPATSLFHHFIFLQLHRERSGLINIHIWRLEKKTQQSPGCQLQWWALTFCSFQWLI